MLCSSITSTYQTTKFCHAYFSFTRQIGTSKSRSAQRRWPSTVMSSDCSTRLARSESQTSVIRLEQLLASRLQVLRRRQVPPHHHPHTPPSLQEPSLPHGQLCRTLFC